MTKEEFEQASDEAHLLEKKVIEYAPYTGKVEISNALDLEPKDYVGLNYADMLNLYERTQKIISASGMEVYRQTAGQMAPAAPIKTEPTVIAPTTSGLSPKEEIGPKVPREEEKIPEKTEELEIEREAPAPLTQPAPAPTAETKEVEEKLRQMSSEAIAQAEEVSKIQAPEAKAATTDELSIEIEHGYVHRPESEVKKTPMELDLELPPQITPPQQLDLERERERLTAPPQSKPQEKEMVREKEREITRAPEVELPPAPAAPAAPPVPPALRERADEAAAKRYTQIEEQVKAALGSGADEITLKKRMLELTKELFNKNTGQNRREAIKHEIAVLKNMLSGGVVPQTSAPSRGATTTSGQAPSSTSAADGKTSLAMLGTLVASQESELSAAKDKIIETHLGEIEEIKKQFHSELAETDNAAAKKRIFDKFVTNVTEVVKKLPEETDAQKGYLEEKHSAEIKKILETSADKSVNAKVDERLRSIEEGYGPEFTKVKAIIAKDIDGIIDAASLEIFEKEEAPISPEAAKTLEEAPVPPQEEEGEEVEAIKPKKGKTPVAAPAAPAKKTTSAAGGSLVNAMKTRRTISEINSTDESTLLLFLKSKDAAYYKKYQGKKVSKAEAILQAKRLMAKDKGLGDEVIKKFF